MDFIMISSSFLEGFRNPRGAVRFVVIGIGKSRQSGYVALSR